MARSSFVVVGSNVHVNQLIEKIRVLEEQNARLRQQVRALEQENTLLSLEAPSISYCLEWKRRKGVRFLDAH
jgi:regulator of replication initiation timing